MPEENGKQEQEKPGSVSAAMDRRFDRMGRLVGDDGMQRLTRSHVMVVGVGGVGSWAAESLVRSGVGTLTLVDFDDVCITNFNRQVHAVEGRVGEPKAGVMAERMRQINPSADVRVMACFYSAETADAILSSLPDFVIDAIDCVTSKCHLLAECRNRGIRAVCATGSGGRLDPTRIAVADLSETDVDPLARAVRRILRRDHGFPPEGGGAFGIPAVFSREPAAMPRELAYDNGLGFRCVCAKGNSGLMNCDERNLILGNASFVTGACGLHCAAIVVRALLEPASAAGCPTGTFRERCRYPAPPGQSVAAGSASSHPPCFSNPEP
jgi:tRNA A37 threonylcarbamoyladenosine dehydratase